MIDTAAIKARFEALAPFLGERDRRLWAASEAYAAGRGGILAVSAVTGIRTVLVPMNRPTPTRTPQRRDGDSQLTLGLG